FAHVADVEEPDAVADRVVFLDDAGVLDGHVPAAEVDHFGPEGAMDGVERSGTERGRCWHENPRLTAPKWGVKPARSRRASLRADGHAGRHDGVVESRRMKGLESVPHAEDRFDVAVGIRAEFLTEAADMDVEGAGADFGTVAPNAHQ